MIPLDELKTALKVQDDVQDDYLESLERSAVAVAERQTGKYLGPVRVLTRYYTGRGTSRIYLPAPLVDVLTVTERSYVGDTAAGTVLVADDDYRLDLEGGFLLRTGGFLWGSGLEYEVELEQGYDDVDYEAGVPYDLRQGVLKLVTLWFHRRLPISESNAAAELPLSLRDLFAAHRAPLVGPQG